MLRALFASAEFAASTGAKVKRPYEDLVSTVRTLGITPAATGTAGIQALSWLASEAGQPALGWGPPNGYPDVAAAWQSPDQTLRRWNQHVGLAAKWWPSTTDLTYPGVERLLPSPLPATHGALLDVLSTKPGVPRPAPGPPHRDPRLPERHRVDAPAVDQRDGHLAAAVRRRADPRHPLLPACVRDLHVDRPARLHLRRGVAGQPALAAQARGGRHRPRGRGDRHRRAWCRRGTRTRPAATPATC
ncbi:hypothetical protein GCM10025868_30110 [Angustibacter aerolatus]|uniref:Uncharacterized protein n=1 Tax=Angustibacter aerolatus TaxID=1162965 RepID=A0ABQ6JHP9_9ACTN|nr:DUF1800 family protein [Angustibacter aerolatus]GMA87761.1 hypothetical protein GCM10025868_30110 [Angustibacter aerolatus]